MTTAQAVTAGESADTGAPAHVNDSKRSLRFTAQARGDTTAAPQQPTSALQASKRQVGGFCVDPSDERTARKPRLRAIEWCSQTRATWLLCGGSVQKLGHVAHEQATRTKVPLYESRPVLRSFTRNWFRWKERRPLRRTQVPRFETDLKQACTAAASAQAASAPFRSQSISPTSAHA